MEYQKYFQSYEDYFWELKWYADNDYNVVFTYEIFDGTTIAYSDYIFKILDFLSEQSIPPFGSLLLAVLATNYESSVTRAALYEFAKEKEKEFSKTNLQNVDAAMSFLNTLASVPATYKSGNKALLLFETVFFNCHNRISSDKAQSIIQGFKNNINSYQHKNGKIAFNEANFVKDFRTLALLNIKFPTVESLLKAIENLPDDASIAIDEEIANQNQISEKKEDFIDQLIKEDKTFHVGVLIKRIWSGLNIPLHHNTPSNQPLGGISDLVNKGSFDKLLISEFANDDLIFMSRLANGEALYMQREVPPEDDKFKRILLIDSTLMNWGNPKIIAFATALAIAKHPKTDIECNLFVLGSDYKEIGFENVYNVIEGLNNLSSKLDCSMGLDLYCNKAEDKKQEKELFLILSEDSLKTETMQKALYENFDALSYLITTSVDGEINFYKIKNKSRKHIQRIKLELEEFWKKEGKIKNNEAVTNEPVPILYPLKRNYRQVFNHGTKFYSCQNGILFSFTDSDVTKGFQKVCSGIPMKEGEFAMYQNRLNEKIIVNLCNGVFSTFNLSNNDFKKSTLSGELNEITTLFGQDEACYVTNGLHYWKFTTDDQFVKIAEPDIKQEHENYKDLLAEFKNRYKYAKNRYDVIGKLNHAFINEWRHYVVVNNHALSPEGFMNSADYDDSLFRIETSVNLILKHKGIQPIAAVKALSVALKISLSQAKKIIDGDLQTILNGVNYEYAEKIKQQIEDTGAVCYIEVKGCKSQDGSNIVHQDGILIFESSDKNIPKFYVPAIINKQTAFSTDYEFAGNEYFLPENNNLTIISIDSFFEKYINPFARTILSYGT